ncbi:amino acid adenylation domain-containing protein [Nocardia sp. 2]|uniref:Amino acid adenylation domain-containing protein n=1 Tax=Nocardia acididurans TaxID=2802282 RepID=A0ABS1M9A0_9NOCA|nr:non-ribosomal peptide synthetase [Nocardia acididurans]MBL1077227.1 amino acid adenylation domain-containing protein [Nocardia acididurans]
MPEDTAQTVLERRKQLLQQRLREQQLKAAAPEPVPARDPGAPSPLSAAQRRIWFVQNLDPADTAMNVCVAYRLTGELDADRLRQAFETLSARHEVLRTTYHVGEDGEPYQIASADAGAAFKQHDMTALPQATREQRLPALIQREFARPFSLSADAPLRATLLRTDAAEHILVLVAHHIGWDDSSWPVFFTEINHLYRGADANALPPLTAQYIDVETGAAAATESEADIEFWRGALTPVPSRVDLPGTRALSRSSKADRRVRELPAGLMDRVGEFARARSATPFTVLLSAYQALVQRYTAATDFLVSVPVTNRRDNASQALIGYFGNTVLVRSTPDPAMSFTELVDGTRDTSAGAFGHQHVGIDRVIRTIGAERSGGRDALANLVQLSFSVRGDANRFDLPGVVAEELPYGTAVGQEELGLMVVLDDAGVRVEATYLVDELDGDLIADLLDNYAQLLDRALAEPERPLRTVNILRDGDHARILERSSGPRVDDNATTIVDLLAAQIAATPDAEALVSDTERLTYRELGQRVNRLSHWLIAREAGPETVVALRMTTSVEFVVAALAVLRAGAAYLPIDPAYPSDRIEYLLDDAAPALVLDAAALAAVEQDAAELSDQDPADADRTRPLRPSNIAYVIYTSGSTGKPKGVPVPHNAIAEHLIGFQAQWGLTPADRMMQSTSVSFDASLADIFVPLISGATVVVPKPNAFRDLDYITEFVARHEVSVLHMVPSMLATFLLLPGVSDLRSVRRVVVGGEALPGEVADRFAGVFDATLRNHYGPTEAVVCSTHRDIAGPQGAGIVSIGNPNQNVTAYLLDSALQLVPDGVVGEIYLGGAQLARGYLGRAGQSAERFVADPFAPGGRLYRTGDLARRDADGALEFIGRADEQVKIRGYRIELGEVEAAISARPGVAHCVVIVAEHEISGPILAAYVVAEPEVTLDLDTVRTGLEAVLPAHLVPSAFTLIDEIPLTAHGKLDKRALPAPELAVAREYRAPATPTEIRLAGLYGSLFERDTIGADDSFFDLGGHSLLAARLITMIRAEFGIEIDMRVPFDKPTVTGLAAHLVAAFRSEFGIDIDEFSEIGAAAEAAALPQTATRPELGGRTRPEYLPLSYSQRAYWLQRRLEGAIDGENVTYPVRFDGPLDIAALRAALDDVVARHESLRTTFPEHEGNPYQLIHPFESIEVPLEDIGSDPERLRAELDADAAYVFDLGSEALLKLRLLAVGPQTHVLSILMHHIIADRRSCQIFVEDLTRAYRARVRGQAPEWTELAIQFADFALWQREIFDRGADRQVSAYGQAQLDYWRDALSGLPDEIAVAHDKPRPPVLGRNGVSAARTVSAATWDRLRVLAEETSVTEFMLFQAVSAVVLNALGGGEDLAIGAAVANRIGEATDELIGLFANVVVLRNDLSGEPTPRVVLDRVREASLDAISKQGVPFERLVETLNPPRSLARNPLFQVMMHFRHQVSEHDFSGDGEVVMNGIAGYYDVSFMDFHFDYNVMNNGELAVRIVVNPDLYEAATADVFVDVLARVLEAFAEQADVPVAALNVVPEGWDSSRSVVHEANAAAADWYNVGAGDPPRTETERTLVAILEELLGITEITRDDGFFGLGGDSVIAIQWAARATEEGLPLNPQLVFEHFTIADLAAAVDEVIANPPAEEAPAAEHAPMSLSGLDSDALAALQADWGAQD